MFDLSASVAVYLLPVVSEEAKLRGAVPSQEMCLDGFDPICVGILILVNQYDRIFVRHDAPELGVIHESDGQDKNVVVMDGDSTVVDASVPKLVFDSTLAEVADFSESVGPMLELRQLFPEISLETADERPAESMDGIAIDEWAPVGPDVDLVLRYVGERYARDLLVPLRQNVLIAVHDISERLDERIGLSGAGSGFDEKALFALKAAIHLGEGTTTGLLGRIQVFRDLSHCQQPQLRGYPRRRPDRSPRLHMEYRQPPAISIRQGCSRARPNRFRRWRT